MDTHIYAFHNMFREKKRLESKYTKMLIMPYFTNIYNQYIVIIEILIKLLNSGYFS